VPEVKNKNKKNQKRKEKVVGTSAEGDFSFLNIL
jgi:hypothetical protein